MSELYKLGIAEAREGLEKGDFSSEDIVKSVIGRYREKNADIGANKEEAETKYEEYRTDEEARQRIAKRSNREMKQKNQRDDRKDGYHGLLAFFEKKHPYPL